MQGYSPRYVWALAGQDIGPRRCPVSDVLTDKDIAPDESGAVPMSSDREVTMRGQGRQPHLLTNSRAGGRVQAFLLHGLRSRSKKSPLHPKEPGCSPVRRHVNDTAQLRGRQTSAAGLPGDGMVTLRLRRVIVAETPADPGCLEAAKESIITRHRRPMCIDESTACLDPARPHAGYHPSRHRMRGQAAFVCQRDCLYLRVEMHKRKEGPKCRSRTSDVEGSALKT